MNMGKQLIAGGILLTIISGAAVADDWSGWHVGGHLGYSSNDLSGLYDTAGSTPYADFSKAEESGAAYGLQGGYDWQNGNIVYGVEVNYTKTNLDGETNIDGEGDYERFDTEKYWSISGRIGTLVNDKTLIYATAGVARVYNELEVELNDQDGNNNRSYHETAALLGAGVEYAYSKNWSIRGEALYINLDKEDNDLTDLDDGDSGDSISIGAVKVLKIGLNYRF